jgi:hypothetical protein
MKSNLALTFLALSSLPFFPTTNVTAQDDANNNNVKTLTGCLVKSSKDGFRLTAEDGSTWDLISNTAALSQHVGHTVTATGKVLQVENHPEKGKGEAVTRYKEHGHLDVTDITTVSESCKN